MNTSVRAWPEGVERVRPLYQILFLCTWSHVCNAPHLARLAKAIARETST